MFEYLLFVFILLVLFVVDVVIDDGSIYYLLIDSSFVGLFLVVVDCLFVGFDEKMEDNVILFCMMCLDVLVEGVCMLCGYMVGCMFCLNEIKVKNWGCFVCRVNIN